MKSTTKQRQRSASAPAIVRNRPAVRCPFCKSTNVESRGEGDAVSRITFRTGLVTFYKCNDCKSDYSVPTLT